ncbi:FK506-binding protein 4 [Symbiodinium microadriaticum]|uniref:peptidylprolyl isomerase n=1 Tax=Symbiodinium microadriaticum TaxID=2951 RepID=A0A1Q9E4D3_SYMMI|nr:FK506-binding protein 4 [Symbiodinium microadriaticum]
MDGAFTGSSPAEVRGKQADGPAGARGFPKTTGRLARCARAEPTKQGGAGYGNHKCVWRVTRCSSSAMEHGDRYHDDPSLVHWGLHNMPLRRCLADAFAAPDACVTEALVLSAPRPGRVAAFLAGPQEAATSFVPKPSAGTLLDWVELPSGLRYKDEVLGTGAAAEPGGEVSLHYTGRLQNGIIFDSSKYHRMPISFELGVGKVIPGWDEGVEGMRVGGKRRLYIPADLAYGEQAVGKIPPNSTLIFETELVDAKPPGEGAEEL